MYELRNGSARLVGALERAKEDPERMRVLADLLYYYEDQMKEDIQALSDYYWSQRKAEE